MRRRLSGRWMMINPKAAERRVWMRRPTEYTRDAYATDTRRQAGSTRMIVRSRGPWAPRTRMRSMSPVLLGPVISPTKLG